MIENIKKHVGDDEQQGFKLNRKVQQVKYYAEKGVKVTTFNTVTNEQEIYEGTIVVSTVSLGVLKAESIEFVPSFDETKKKAINQMKMGEYGKIFMKFEEKFWPDKTSLFVVSDDLKE